LEWINQCQIANVTKLSYYHRLCQFIKMQIIDLTHPMGHQMPVLPGDTMVELKISNQIVNDGYTNYQLTTGMHTGTHIDGPLHMISNQPQLSGFSVDCFIGPGILLDVKHQPLDQIMAHCLQYNLTGYIAIIHTGFSDFFNEHQYFKDYPVIDPILLDYLIEQKVKMIGIDTPSPDYPPYLYHKRILGAHILIIENLTNLKNLIGLSEFEIIALPLKIQADSSPARVVARTLNQNHSKSPNTL